VKAATLLQHVTYLKAATYYYNKCESCNIITTYYILESCNILLQHIAATNVKAGTLFVPWLTIFFTGEAEQDVSNL